MTVLESIRLSTDFLEKKGIESPRLNAELLLSSILNCKRFDLYLMYDRPLKENEVEKYREFLKRRSQFEPLQYIIGSVEFYGHIFKVNRDVLIPRQETEVLIETISSTFPKENNLNILDIGTGTGNIPICLAKHFTNANFVSIDVSVSAIGIAKENTSLNNVSDRIEFINTDIANLELHGTSKFDIIVSNPPYVALNEYQTLQPEIRVFEPMNSITDYSDGYSFYRLICEKVKYLLNPNGYLFFELGQGQFEKVTQIMESFNLRDIKIKKDYLNIERVIYGVLS